MSDDDMAKMPMDKLIPAIREHVVKLPPGQILTAILLNTLCSRMEVQLNQINRLEQHMRDAGVCRSCGQHWSHDIEEPFAHCGCHTTEWASEFSPYQKLQEMVYNMHTVIGELVYKDCNGDWFVSHNDNVVLNDIVKPVMEVL